MEEFLKGFEQFYRSEFGQILFRGIFVAVPGGAIYLFTKKIADRFKLYKSVQAKNWISLFAGVLSYSGNIGLSIFMAYLNTKWSYETTFQTVGWGIVYGLTAISMQAFVMNDKFYEVLKVVLGIFARPLQKIFKAFKK